MYPDLGDEAGRKMALLYDAISGEQDMGVKPGTMDFIRRIACTISSRWKTAIL